MDIGCVTTKPLHMIECLSLSQGHKLILVLEVAMAAMVYRTATQPKSLYWDVYNCQRLTPNLMY